MWRRPAVMFQMHALAAGTVINFSWAAGIKGPADDCCGLRVGCEISAVQALAAAARPVTMSINQITGGGGGLGSESAGTMRPRMAQHCGPTAAVVVSCDPTFAPRTPTTSPENNCRVHLSLVCPRRGLVKGACVQEGGQMSSTGADRTEPAPRTPCQQTHTAFSLSRPGGVAVPCCIASIGLHSEVIQHPQLLLTRCPQPSVYTVKVTFNVIQGHRY